MIFVHGFPEFWFSWRYQLKEFGKDYYAVAIDQRGYGQSDKPAELSAYRVDNMVEDIRALASHLGELKFAKSLGGQMIKEQTSNNNLNFTH